MRQRLGIATALLGDPDVLILDEPANGLDPAGIRWMRDLLRGFADQGGTVLLSSHLLHEIEVIADDLVVIGHGRIVAQGTKAELLASAGTLVRTSDVDALARGPARTPASTTAPIDGGLRVDADPELVARSPTAPASPSRAPRRRRRRPGGDVPRAHRRDRTVKEQQHDHRNRDPVRTSTGPPNAPTRPSARSR